MSDDDDFNTIHLNEEQTQAIIDWAVQTAAVVILMGQSPDHKDNAEMAERLDGFIESVEIMWTNMPAVLAVPAITIAREAISDSVIEEETVAQFLQQIEDL